MKLYATVQSERATKGQGGEYLIVNLQDERRITFAALLITKYPGKALPVINIMSNGEVIEALSEMERYALQTEIDIKAKNQKDEH